MGTEGEGRGEPRKLWFCEWRGLWIRGSKDGVSRWSGGTQVIIGYVSSSLQPPCIQLSMGFAI